MHHLPFHRRAIHGLSFSALAAAVLLACQLGTNEGEAVVPGSESAARETAASSDSTPTAEPSSGGLTSASRNAHVSFHLVDAPADVKSIVVTVARLDAELAHGWTTLVEHTETIDLLALRDGKYLDLGVAELPPGHVGQLRLHLADAVAHITTNDGVDHPVTIPSAAQSGIKLVGGFDVPECGAGKITIDFDGERSIHFAGAGGKKDAGTDGWTMRPVVKIKAVVLQGECAAPDAGPAEAGTDDDDATSDACADVQCSEQELCENGACRPAE